MSTRAASTRVRPPPCQPLFRHLPRVCLPACPPLQCRRPDPAQQHRDSAHGLRSIGVPPSIALIRRASYLSQGSEVKRDDPFSRWSMRSFEGLPLPAGSSPMTIHGGPLSIQRLARSYRRTTAEQQRRQQRRQPRHAAAAPAARHRACGCRQPRTTPHDVCSLCAVLPWLSPNYVDYLPLRGRRGQRRRHQVEVLLALLGNLPSTVLQLLNNTHVRQVDQD